MAKEKRNLYEEVEFGNDYGYAMQVKQEAETQLYEIQKIWGLAIAGTVCGGIGMVLAFHPIFIMIGFVMGCVCYSKVGGFGIAAKCAYICSDVQHVNLHMGSSKNRLIEPPKTKSYL